MKKNYVNVAVPAFGNINLVGKVMSNNLIFQGFPGDIEIHNIKYEPTNMNYYILCSSKDLPHTPTHYDVPIIRLEHVPGSKGNKDTVIFNINNRF